MKKPAADTNKPIDAKILSLNLSYNHPLTGAKTARAAETGIR
jgi:hypothetical protein